MLVGCTIDDGYFDLDALSEVHQLLEFQGCFVDTVREFHVNLKQLSDMYLGCSLFGSEVSLLVSFVASLLDIPRDGFDMYDVGLLLLG